MVGELLASLQPSFVLQQRRPCWNVDVLITRREKQINTYYRKSVNDMFTRRHRRYILTADVSVIIIFIDARFGAFWIRFDFGQKCVLVCNFWKLFTTNSYHLRVQVSLAWVAGELNLLFYEQVDIISLMVFEKCYNYQHFSTNSTFFNRIYPNFSAKIIIFPNAWYQIVITNN